MTTTHPPLGMQALLTKKLDQLRRMIRLDSAHAAVDRILPELRRVLISEPVDENVFFLFDAAAIVSALKSSWSKATTVGFNKSCPLRR